VRECSPIAHTVVPAYKGIQDLAVFPLQRDFCLKTYCRGTRSIYLRT